MDYPQKIVVRPERIFSTLALLRVVFLGKVLICHVFCFYVTVPSVSVVTALAKKLFFNNAFLVYTSSVVPCGPCQNTANH